MRAREHTTAMLQFWVQGGITALDLAVRRACGTMIWHRQCPPDPLPLPWLRAENVRRAEIYIRPASTLTWPMILLDDVELRLAQRIAHKYAALVVHTSPAGGCHLWLCLTRALNQQQRYYAQRWLIPRVNADIGSVSGEHLGRLAGTRNWKRDGVWVNVVNPDPSPRPAWDPTPALSPIVPANNRDTPHPRMQKNDTGIDPSESGKEWGWVCGALEAGLDPEIVYRRLLDRASQRRGSDAERYARYTLQRALQQQP
ncbi:MAG: hypothetical protein GY949_08750 [Gammaproteobacteria bacterium]|nr:hypothetical protein [Gammaproteobacteria bacterium]